MQITSLLKIPAYNKLLPYLTFEAYNPQTTNNFSQAAHPIHQTVQIPISVCTLLNEDAKKQDEEYVTDEDVKTKYPELTVATTNNATVTTSDHCELTLALNAIKSGPTLAPIKIGVSKRICWLCKQYLDFLSESKGVRILISEYQGKIHSGWRVPARSPEDVKMIMHNLVRREITEIREQIIGRKKSDSFPPEDLEPIAEEDPDIVSKYHNFSWHCADSN